LTDFNETWHENHSRRVHSTFVILNFPTPVTSTSRLCEIMRWE